MDFVVIRTWEKTEIEIVSIPSLFEMAVTKNLNKEDVRLKTN